MSRTTEENNVLQLAEIASMMSGVRLRDRKNCIELKLVAGFHGNIVAAV